MGPTCPHCGQPVSDEFSLDGDHEPEKAPEPGVEGRKVLVWGGVLLAGWLVVALVLGFVQGDDNDSAAPEPVAEPTLVPTPIPTATPVTAAVGDATIETTEFDGSVEDLVGPAADAGALAGTFVESAPVRSMTTRIGQRDDPLTFIYPTADGAAMLDFASSRVLSLPIGQRARSIEGDWSFLRIDADSHLAIDPTGPQIAVLNGTPLAAASVAHGVAITEGSNPGSVLIGSSSGVIVGDVPVPPRSTVLTQIDGFGVIALEGGKATSIATPDGFTQISEWPVVDANEAGRVEVRCANALQCDIVVVLSDGSEHVAPEDFDGDDGYRVSPDGSALLRFTREGSGDIWFVGTPARSFVSSSSIEQPVWAPDSSFVAWLGNLDESRWGPSFNAIFLGSGDLLTVPLTEFEAPVPLSAALAVVAVES